VSLKAPFPWFGGKSRIAPTVWQYLGEVRNYVEPFAGSLAVLLERDYDQVRTETVNDADGMLANFWRAMARDPEAVITAAENPVNECDLHSRHVWLLGQRERITERLMGDPDWCDAKAAGWWVWGLCCWIGSGWCSGNGPWTSVDGVLTKTGMPGANRKLPHLGTAGRGVNRQLPHLGTAGRGVNRKLPHLGNAGRGVNRQLPHLGDAGRGVNRKLPHMGDAVTRQRYWLGTLVERLRYVRVACGDWSRVCTDSVLLHGNGRGNTGVFLDPPYSVGADLYSVNGGQLQSEVGAWCRERGDDPRLRIVLCGYDGEYDLPGWRVVPWEAGSSYGKSAGNDANSKRERLWISPHCVVREEDQQCLL